MSVLFLLLIIVFNIKPWKCFFTFFYFLGNLVTLVYWIKIDKSILLDSYVSNRCPFALLTTVFFFSTFSFLSLKWSLSITHVWYSWWVLSSLILIDRVHLIEKDKLVGFVLDCQFVSMIRVVFKNMLDKENWDGPDDAVDVFLTYFGVVLARLRFKKKKTQPNKQTLY